MGITDQEEEAPAARQWSFSELIDALPYSEADTEHLYGHAVGLTFIDSRRLPEQCNGYAWAKGPLCHLIKHRIKLTRPVNKIEKPRNPGSIWSIIGERPETTSTLRIPGSQC